MPVKIPPIKIGIVDDQNLFRAGLATYINTATDDMEVTLQAVNGLDLHNQLKKIEDGNIPQLLLLDISMPQMDGFETMQMLKTSYPMIKVMVLSVYSAEDIILKMLKLGAHSYAVKDISPESLLDSIKKTLSTDYYYPPKIQEMVNRNLRSDDNGLSKENPEASALTQKEILILNLICTELTATEIAEKLMLSKRTVEYHLNSLYTKTATKSRSGLVVYAIKNGLAKV